MQADRCLWGGSFVGVHSGDNAWGGSLLVWLVIVRGMVVWHVNAKE